LRAALILALAVAALVAQAQDSYPSRPVRIVVPFARDGAADIAARLLADRVMPHLKQGLVVENVAGAGGRTGTEAAAKSAVDGYTLLFATDVTLVTGPILERRPGYDPLAAFAPISLISSMSSVLAAGPTVQARNLDELIALVRGSPGRYRYATTGPGASTWLGAELFKALFKADIAEVRFRTWPEAQVALGGGGADLVFATSVLLETPVREGRARPIAVMGHAPLGTFPGVATTAAQGARDLTMYSWTGLVAPAGTPEAILQRLNGAVRQALEEPETKILFGKYRLAAEGTPSDWFRDFLRAETAKWRSALAAP
jgi:tripartite-type tricarboxylate transporter receptor subunit TctC